MPDVVHDCISDEITHRSVAYINRRDNDLHSLVLTALISSTAGGTALGIVLLFHINPLLPALSL